MDSKTSFDFIISQAPDNFVIQDALAKCYEVVEEHNHILCSCSGGGDSDVVVDMLIRCGAKDKTDFVFFDTGLEYDATHEHLDYLEHKYGIKIDRAKPIKSIPKSVREYGVPFWGKFASDMISRLQKHGFQFEDEPYEVLIERYPNCKSALGWWCNIQKGKTQQYIIDRAPYMKEFMVANPPKFKISSKCCDYAKKKVAHQYTRGKDYDLQCIGVRLYEGGARSFAYKNCFSEGDGIDQFRPIFWFRDTDKEEYCRHYGVEHSRCYTEYGLQRTGCFGCPYGKRFEEELASIERFEPKLLKAANSIFGESYEYTREFMAFRAKKREQKEKNNSKNS